MKLDYHDNCPAEYEPPGFRPMDNANAVHFSRKPFYMCGKLWGKFELPMHMPVYDVA